MKKIITILTAGILGIVMMLSVTAAEVGFISDKWRFNDFVGIMSSEDEDILIEKAFGIIEEVKCDFPVCIFNTLEDSMRLDEFSERFYENNSFGYGKKKDGVLLVVDLKNNAFEILLFGEPKIQMSQETYRGLVDSFRENYSDETKSGLEIFSRYYDDAVTAVLYSRENPVKRVLKEDGMPYWYPDDPESFVRFHGEKNEQVTDNAGLLSASQIMELTETAEVMKNAKECDFVVFTDNDTHGIGAEKYAEEFFIYNGFGCGDEYKGVVLFISTEQGSSGFCEYMSGSVKNCADADELKSVRRTMNERIGAGDYYGAVKAYLSCLDDLLRIPPWYPEGTTDIFGIDRENRTTNTESVSGKPRVADRAGLFDYTSIGRLTERAERLVAETQVEILILTDTTTSGLSCDDYADDYRFYNGYPENCIVLFVKEYGEKAEWTQIGTGTAAVVNEYGDKFAERLAILIGNGDYTGAVTEYMDQAEYLLKHGRLMPEKAYFVTWVIAAIAVCAAGAAVVTVIKVKNAAKSRKTKKNKK